MDPHDGLLVTGDGAPTAPSGAIGTGASADGVPPRGAYHMDSEYETAIVDDDVADFLRSWVDVRDLSSIKLGNVMRAVTGRFVPTGRI